MDLSHSDLLNLLSLLEGELQAREVVIAVLKAEQTKRLLYPDSPIRNLRAKSVCYLNQASAQGSSDTATAVTIVPKGGNKLGAHLKSPGGCFSHRSRISPNDPYAALFRDSFHAYDHNFDEYATSALFHFQLKHLDKLIEGHRKSQCLFKNQLTEVSSKLNSVFAELEDERRRSESFDRKKMEERVEQLERENESLRNQVIQISTALENEKEREKKMILHLLSERKQLIMKLIEKQQENAELVTIINANKGKISEMIEGLEDESKRSLQMELDLEKLSSEYKIEVEQLKSKLSTVESQNQLLQAQLEKLTNGLSLDTSLNDVNTNISGKVNQSQNVIASSILSTGTVKVTPGTSQQYSSVPLSSSSLSSSSSSSLPSSSMMTGTVVRNSSRSNVQVTAAAFHNQSYNPTDNTSTVSNTSNSNSNSNTNSNINSNNSTSNVLQGGSLALTKNQLTKSQSSDSCITTTSGTTGVTTGAKVSVAAAVAAVEEKVTQIMTKAPIVRKISAGSTSNSLRGAPPPVPPNKPILPAQVLKEKSKFITQQSLPLRPSNTSSSSSSNTQSIEGETSIIGNFSVPNQGSKSVVDLNSVTLPTSNVSPPKSRLPIKVYSVPSSTLSSALVSSNGKTTFKTSPNGDQAIAPVTIVDLDNPCHPTVPQSVNSLDSVESHFAPELADFHRELVSDVKAVNI